MEKLALIDYTLEDDSLLPSSTNPENQSPQPLEIVLPLSPAFVEENCTNSGGVDREEGIDVPVTPAVEPHVQIVEPAIEPPVDEPTVPRTMSRSNSERVPGDGQQVPQHGRHVNGPFHEKLAELTEPRLNVTEVSSRPVKKMRSARAASNLRKSLAWDKAFSTDEGVLDFDELPFVTKTPRKLPKLGPLEIPDILGIASPLTVSAPPAPLSGLDKANANVKTVADGETISSHSAKDSILSDCHPSDVGNSMNCNARSLTVRSPPSYPKVSTPARTPSKLDTKAIMSENTRLVSTGQIIKADVLKGTRLRLPSTFTGKKDKIDMSSKVVSTIQNDFLRRCQSSSAVLNPYSPSSSALSKKVSSVSKKVKDAFVKVFPGGFGGSSKKSKGSGEGVVGSHHGSSLKALQVGRTLGAIGEDVNVPVPASVPRSGRSFLSGSSTETNASSIRKTGLQAEMSSHEVTTTEANTNIKKKGVQAEAANCEPTTTDALGDGTIVPRLKGSSRQKTVALLVGLHGKAGRSPKAIPEKQSSYSSKVSAVFSKKKSGPAASTVPSVEKRNPVNAAQSNTSYSSGLRLPSPKIGFFDSTGPSKGDQTSSLVKRVASGTSYWRSSTHLPPKPQHGLPPGHSGQRHTGKKSFAAAAASRIARSGIPTAPHIKSSGNREKRLVPSISAPNSPHKNHHGLLSPTSHQAVAGRHLLSETSSDRSHSSISELSGHAVRSEPSGTSRKIKLESRDGDSDQLLRPVERREVDAQSVVTDVPSYGLSTRHEAEVNSESPGEETRSSKLVSASLGNTNTPVETVSPPSTSIELAGLTEKDVSGCRLSFTIEDLNTESKVLFGVSAIDSVLSREGAGSVIDALTTSSIEATMSNKLSQERLDLSECSAFARIGGELACRPDHDAGSVGDAAEVKILRAQERQPEMRNVKLESSFVHNSTLESDHWSKCSGGKRSFKLDCKLVREDSAMVKGAGNKELISEISRNIPDVGEQKLNAAVNSGTEEEEVKASRKSSHARHPENENAKCSIDDVDSPSHWSDGSRLRALTKSTHTTRDMKRLASPISSLSKRLSGTRIVRAETTQQEIPKSTVTSTSPIAALDSQTGKFPLAMNVGLLNVIGTSPASRKERMQLVFDPPASEVKSGQENRFSQGLAGSAHAHKSKQQNPYSSLNLELEADGTTELSFPFSEQRLRALEAAGHESLQMKSGAVQHSPPNKKTNPNQNPWSPVKRNGQQLGPFDCTKKCTNASPAK